MYRNDPQSIATTDAGRSASLIGKVDRPHFVVGSILAPFSHAAQIDDGALLRLVQEGAPGFTIANIAGTSGAPIPVVINLPDGADSPGRGYTFLMFRGVPEDVAFSAGFRLRNNWAVSLADAQRLTLIARPAYQGAFSLQVFLYRSTDMPPLIQNMKVEIRPATTAKPAPPLENAASSGSAQASPEVAQTAAIATGLPRPFSMPAISPVEEKAMLLKGWDMVGTGNIASARFLFQDLAVKGSGPGAFALAQTYDPKFLRTIVVVGPQQANVKEARKWYRLAAERGEGNAQERLKSLENE